MRVTIYGEDLDIILTNEDILYILEEKRDLLIIYKFRNHYQNEINTRFGTHTGWYYVKKNRRQIYNKIYHEYAVAKAKERDL